jgi:ferritin
LTPDPPRCYIWLEPINTDDEEHKVIGKKMLDALNEQINAELYSAYLYRAMAAQFEADNLRGFAHWMDVQAKEEENHARKIYEFLVDRGGRVVLKAIGAPPAEWKSALAVFEDSYAHEQKVTGLINRLFEMAAKENDYPTQVELQWFVKEQVEEEKSAGDIVAMLKMVGESGTPLIMLDRQLAARGAGK